MPEPKPSFLRRLANFGPLGLFQRARNLLLRPARHELADARREIAGQREEALALRQELAALRRAATDLGLQMDALREQSRQELEAQMTPPRQAIQQLQRQQRLLEGMLVSGLDGQRPPVPGAATPLVSIVLPTRNRAACLVDAIESVLAQSYPHWELLVVDDGSEDDTAAVLARYDDPRLRSFAIAHAGCSAARNHALRQSRGELIAYLDSDNTWFPAFLSAAVRPSRRIPRWSWPTGCSPRKRTHRAN
jgi:hypothetical protein